MMIAIIQDDEKMLAIGAPMRLAKSIMPDIPWKETYVKVYDSQVQDEDNTTLKNFVISPIKFGRRYIKSSVVFREDIGSDKEQLLGKMASLFKGVKEEEKE